MAGKVVIGAQDFVKLREMVTFMLIRQRLSKSGGRVGMM